MEQKNFTTDDLNKPVTYAGLFEYTETFLISKIGELIDERVDKIIKKNNAEQEHNIKDYIDKKMADYTSDIFKRLDKKYEKEKQFKEKVVELFKKHQIGSAEDQAFLDGLVQGS